MPTPVSTMVKRSLASAPVLLGRTSRATVPCSVNFTALFSRFRSGVMLGGDADAGIDDGEAQPRIRARIARPHIQGDGPMLREFHRVVQQVQIWRDARGRCRRRYRRW